MMNLTVPEQGSQMRPRIVVFGVGGGGTNAINNMIRSGLEGVDFVAANTDAQALAGNLAPQKLQLGVTVTRGLGAGARPDVGREAAEEQLDEINALLDGAHMAFITAGMGGGTGTGAAPVIARAARERGILTVGVVTKPFQFEGAVRMRSAEAGIQSLQQFVDTLIVIPNQNLFNIANEKTTFADAFKMADDVLHQGVRGVTDLIITPGQINLDFADIRSVMSEMGKAMMGTGEAEGDNRARQAAEMAINNPLLDDASVKGARGVLINITGGSDLTLFEVEEAADRIREEVDPDANIIFGTALDSSMDGRIRISVVATGIDLQTARQRSLLDGATGETANSALTNGGLSTAPVMPSAWPSQTAARNTTTAAKVPTGGLFSAAVAHQPANASQQSQPQQATGTGTRASLGQPMSGTQPIASSSTYPSANSFYSGLMPEQQGNTLRQPTMQEMQAAQAVQSVQALHQTAQADASSAAPRGTRQGDRFIAPAPVTAPRTTVQPIQEASLSLPQNGGGASPPVQSARKPGFGQRMLGKVKQLVNAIDTDVASTETQRAQPHPQQSQGAVASQGGASASSSATGENAAMASQYQVTQGGKSGLPPVDEPDIVIPAFLRRQAN